MLEAVEQGVDERFIGEQLVPVRRLSIRCDDSRYAAITLVHQPEEGVRLFGFQGQVAQFVQFG